MDSALKWALVGVLGLGACHAKEAPPTVASAIASEAIALTVIEGGEAVPPNAIVVTVSASRVTIAGDRFPIAKVPSDASAGLAAVDLRSDIRGERLVPALEEALAWRLGEAKDAGAALAIVLACDASVPYRVVAELLASTPAEATLYLAARTRTGGLTTVPLSRTRAPIRHGLANPTIWFDRDDAIRIHADPALAAPCDEPVDATTLTPCLGLAVKAHAELVTVGAEPGVRFDAVLRALDIAWAIGAKDLALGMRGPS